MVMPMSKRIEQIRARAATLGEVHITVGGGMSAVERASLALQSLPTDIAMLLEAYTRLRDALESVAGAEGGRGVAGVYGDLAVEALAEVDKIMEEQK